VHLAGAALTSFRKEPTMTTWLPHWFACLVLVFSFVPVAAAPEAEIARLVKQLGDDDFDKREEAAKRLKEIGEPALDALHKATTSADAEVRRRAEGLVAVIEKKLYTEQLRFTGHTDQVENVCVSADGKRVLTSSADKTLRLWDASTGKQLRRFEGHTDRIRGLALSPDGKRALSGSHDKTVRLWDDHRQGDAQVRGPHRCGAQRRLRSGGPGAFLRPRSDDATVGFEHRQERRRLYRPH
jgi:WD domain, G-beta repeat